MTARTDSNRCASENSRSASSALPSAWACRACSARARACRAEPELGSYIAYPIRREIHHTVAPICQGGELGDAKIGLLALGPLATRDAQDHLENPLTSLFDRLLAIED